MFYAESDDINPIKPNENSQSFQLDQSISVLRVVEWYFHCYSNFNRTLCKQTVDTLIRHHVLRRSGFTLFGYVPQKGF